MPPRISAIRGKLHLGRVARNVAHEPVLAKARLDRRIVRSGPLVKAQRDIEDLKHAVKRVPVGRVPVTPVDVVGPHTSANRAKLADATIELLTGEVEIVNRQHCRHLQLVRAVLT